MRPIDLLYAGKAKSVYRTDDPDVYIVKFRDDITAFDGEKKDTLGGKGRYITQKSPPSSLTIWRGTGSRHITSRPLNRPRSRCGGLRCSLSR
ncbi:MAG: phosphoribosylaminoimidazolesuccinocarboxamide synthase [Methanoculleus sp.]